MATIPSPLSLPDPRKKNSGTACCHTEMRRFYEEESKGSWRRRLPERNAIGALIQGCMCHQAEQSGITRPTTKSYGGKGGMEWCILSLKSNCTCPGSPRVEEECAFHPWLGEAEFDQANGLLRGGYKVPCRSTSFPTATWASKLLQVAMELDI